MTNFSYLAKKSIMGLIITDTEGGGSHGRGTLEQEGAIFEEGDRFPPKFQITRDGTLDEDMQIVLMKYKGTPSEALVQHMIDSLIIFRHNFDQLTSAVYIKDGETINIEDDPNIKNDPTMIINKMMR